MSDEIRKMLYTANAKLETLITRHLTDQYGI